MRARLRCPAAASEDGLGRLEFRCGNGEPLRVAFTLDCCDREALCGISRKRGRGSTATYCDAPLTSRLRAV
ncbi:hypothetical protein C7R54_11520 [Achromobacter aloeverae]|uniref:Uncharacterized protein n=1 Tax=Achromobacter aloeverae TaxID=1750518 RepID=A0A4Q1HKZ8_9BURK|nr:hypothetical protein C7R54_11520 [Achromobacter aloeverae]